MENPGQAGLTLRHAQGHPEQSRGVTRPAPRMGPTRPAPRTEAGARIVLTAPLTETIDHAGYFIQMSMASLPMWLEGILNRKYPQWRERRIQRRRLGRLHAGRCARARGVAAAPLHGRRHRLLLSGRSRQVHRPEHARRRGFDAQSAGRDVRRRRLHVDLRVVQAADQLALRARDVREDQEQPVARRTSR